MDTDAQKRTQQNEGITFRGFRFLSQSDVESCYRPTAEEYRQRAEATDFAQITGGVGVERIGDVIFYSTGQMAVRLHLVDGTYHDAPGRSLAYLEPSTHEMNPGHPQAPTVVHATEPDTEHEYQMLVKYPGDEVYTIETRRQQSTRLLSHREVDDAEAYEWLVACGQQEVADVALGGDQVFRLCGGGRPYPHLATLTQMESDNDPGLGDVLRSIPVGQTRLLGTTQVRRVE